MVTAWRAKLRKIQRPSPGAQEMNTSGNSYKQGIMQAIHLDTSTARLPVLFKQKNKNVT